MHCAYGGTRVQAHLRSEEHMSELQSRLHLVCRLLLEKKKHTSELQSRLHLACRLLLEKKRIRSTARHLRLLNSTRCPLQSLSLSVVSLPPPQYSTAAP